MHISSIKICLYTMLDVLNIIFMRITVWIIQTRLSVMEHIHAYITNKPKLGAKSLILFIILQDNTY